MASSIRELNMAMASVGNASGVFPETAEDGTFPAASPSDCLGVIIDKAVAARDAFAILPQERVDAVFKAVCLAVNNAWVLRVRMDESETEMSGVEDERVIPEFRYYTYTGNVRRRSAPASLCVGIVPTANPTLSVICKSLAAIKNRQTLIFTPHPRVAQLVREAVDIVHTAAAAAGTPEGFLGCAEDCGSSLSQALAVADQILMKAVAPNSDSPYRPTWQHSAPEAECISVLTLCPAG
ncbi:MAG: hypothetical protein LIP28_01770 [Deltaproteobacteria bacterium]|nr:hypothetical protein [Deltaproteobacteria bacterium]